MRFSFSVINILLAALQTAIASATKPEPGYDCGNTFIPMKRLNELGAEVIATTLYGESPVKEARLRYSYSGPLFLKPYLLWPVSPTTNDYDGAAQTPFNAVIDYATFKVVSVIVKSDHIVIECRLREYLPQISKTNDFICKPDYVVENEKLRDAASIACPKIRGPAEGFVPPRYLGPRFKNSGKQLYVYPVNMDPSNKFKDQRVPRNLHVVINSKCSIVGAVRRKENSKFEHCKAVIADKPGIGARIKSLFLQE